MNTSDKPDLLIVACSARKKQSLGLLPAIELYDGPAFRILRKQLQTRDGQPTIWILSAKHGLAEAQTPLSAYDVRMTRRRAQELSLQVHSFTEQFAPPGRFGRIFVWAGKLYLLAFPPSFLARDEVHIAHGPIGQKLRLLKEWCTGWRTKATHSKYVGLDSRLTSSRLSRLALQPLNYFIPDWEDYLDPEYDFRNDCFSWNSGERRRLYAHELFKWRPLYDGIVTSLGHIFMAKGFIKDGLKPGIRLTPARQYLHLRRQQLVMGDCGAFSYRHRATPPFSTEQVVKLYTALGVDIGASIDHIPFGDVEENGQLRPLRHDEIEGRIELTTKLAKEFLLASGNNGKFLPMGVIQARSSDEYASLAEEYVKAGYQYIALGGLVPKKDKEIWQIAEAVVSRIEQVFPTSASSIRIHLFGVLREKLLPDLKDLGIASFDSGSYLRKAWLRSDKNYLSNSGQWYTAVRVPFSSDPRFQKNALATGISLEELQQLETSCLQQLRRFDRERQCLSELLDTIIAYDRLLLRSWDSKNFREKYERTLRDAPWKNCKCPVCQALGIDALIFRGFNRNKRRGFHNTWVFFKQLRKLRQGRQTMFSTLGTGANASQLEISAQAFDWQRC